MYTGIPTNNKNANEKTLSSPHSRIPDDDDDDDDMKMLVLSWFAKEQD